MNVIQGEFSTRSEVKRPAKQEQDLSPVIEDAFLSQLWNAGTHLEKAWKYGFSGVYKGVHAGTTVVLFTGTREVMIVRNQMMMRFKIGDTGDTVSLTHHTRGAKPFQLTDTINDISHELMGFGSEHGSFDNFFRKLPAPSDPARLPTRLRLV